MTPKDLSPQYMVKCDECKRVVRWTLDISESYAGTVCDECRGVMKMRGETHERRCHGDDSRPRA